MAEQLNISFELITQGDSLQVRAASPFGEAKAVVDDTSAMDSILVELERENLLEIPNTKIEQFGKTLYKTLFAGKISELGQHVVQEGIRQKQPAQFEVRFDADQVMLAKFPWEMITDDLGRMIVRDGIVDLTRYIAFPQPPPQIKIDLQESLLRVIASPKGLAKITAMDIPLSLIQTLDHATYKLFVQKVLIEKLQLWGIHFDGHGAMLFQCERCAHSNFSFRTYCEKCGKDLKVQKEIGALAFETEGAAEWIPANDFGAVLYNANIQFALLLACESGNTGGQLIFNGLAPNLILAGVPAVVGMQYPIYDNFANHFSHYFYTAILQGKDVLRALRVARQASVKEAWYSPVLYLRHRRDEHADQFVYHTRQIDTATPARVKPGIPFLAKLWIRRPESPPATISQLKQELGTDRVRTKNVAADIKFENVEGRKLRHGDVEVRLTSPFCEVSPASIRLFVSEHLDAPPAMFCINPKQLGKLSLSFSLWQDDVVIATIVHPFECTPVESKEIYEGKISLPVRQDEPPSIIISLDSLETSRPEEDTIYFNTDTSNDLDDQIIIIEKPSQIKVTVTDQAGGKTVTAELPTDAQMSRLIPALVTKMQLPTNMQWGVQHGQSGKQLQPHDTLASVGVKEGDILRLLPSVTAGCFISGTKISLPGQQNTKIETLKEGDKILAYDLEQSKPVASKIKRLYKFSAEEYYVINNKLGVTGSHPIYANKMWITVAELNIGDYLYDEKIQPINVDEIVKVNKKVQVYNIELLDTHVFFADGILVHNVSIKVTVTDQAGGKTVTAELPTDVQMSRLTPALVTKMQLPTNVQYGVQHKQSGKQLQPGDTLISAGAKENDTLRLLPNATGGCFLGGTEIILYNQKHTKIEYLEEGDEILAYDLEKAQLVESVIKHVYKFVTDEYYIINYKLGVTGSHPIYANEKWTTADRLKVGDSLYGEEMQQIKIYDIVKVNQSARIYNLELAENHAFFADGILVHNVHIEVTVIDAKSGKTINIALPSGVDTEHYINLLLSEMGISNGAYVFYSKSAGGKIDLRQSLFKAGVRKGDTLRLVPSKQKENDRKGE